MQTPVLPPVSYATEKLFPVIVHLWVNVKAEPQWGDFWKSTYPAVVPAHHMNKRHWVSIILDGSMTEEQVFQLIAESYTLTQPKRAAKAQSE